MFLWLYMTMFFLGVPAPPISVNTPQSIDFSILDTIAGAVIAIAAMVVLGILLLKYGVVKIGSGTAEDIKTEKAEIKEEFNDALKNIKGSIDELRNDIKIYSKEHQECQRNLPEKYVQWEIFNRIMDKLENDRRERWHRFDEHSHGADGEVRVLRQV